MEKRKNINVPAVIMMVVLMIGCTEQNYDYETVENRQIPASVENQFSILLEQARWGNGDAYLKLAEFHHSENKERQNFLSSLSMLIMADEYGGISSIDSYMKSLPTEDNYRLFYDALECIEKKKFEESIRIADRMISNDFSEGYTIKGVVSVEQGDTLEGKRLLNQAVEHGSDFAELLLATMSDWNGRTTTNLESLSSLADRIPLACRLIGDVYAKSENQGNANEELAAMFYKKADEHGCLGKQAARWLLGYYTRKQIPIGERELERLSILAGNIDCSCEEDTSVVRYNDLILEDSIETILAAKMNETSSNKGSVYVVETQTGRLIANVSIKKDGVDFVPFVDTYNLGRTVMVGAATYLAVLTSGKVKPETVFDTRNGIYGDIRDHNWRRGGYGKISLDQALGLRSEVAFTLAREYAYKDETNLYNERVDSYLGAEPNHTLGILTFYNAIANGGRMIKIVEEGDDNFVLNEQIAKKEHIALLQKGLKGAVKNGIFKKADSEYTDVAACGRTFDIGDNTMRMELCGYFPADNPQYTVMIVLEKQGRPASANGMCGPVVQKIVAALMR